VIGLAETNINVIGGNGQVTVTVSSGRVGCVALFCESLVVCALLSFHEGV